MIRNEALRKRRALPVFVRTQKSRRIAVRLRDLFSEASEGMPVLCFYPLYDEVDLREWYQELLTEGRRLFFPVTENGSITFFMVQTLDDFTEGAFHVMEPTDRTHPFLGGKEYFCVTPGVAFDTSGHRIGFGKGYYDRFFAKFPAGKKIGVAFEEQIFTNVPVNATDVPVDEIVFA